MPPVLIWLISYALPALAGGITVKFLLNKKESPNRRNSLITHLTLVASILISQYFIYSFGLTFPWNPNLLSIIAYALSVLIAFNLIGKLGLWFGISALIQQLTILSITLILLPYLPLYLILILIVPLFVWCHPIENNHQLIRAAIFIAWGIISILLFIALGNIYLNALLHTLLGAVLIGRGVLYARSGDIDIINSYR